MNRLFRKAKGHRPHHKGGRPRSRFRMSMDVPRPLLEAAARIPKPDVSGGVRGLKSALAAHPRRAAVLGVLGLLLLAFVATASLPLALLSRSPGLAALLAPNNALVLKVQAQAERSELNRLTAAAASAEGVPGAQDPATPRGEAGGADPAADATADATGGEASGGGADSAHPPASGTARGGEAAAVAGTGDGPLGSEEQIAAVRTALADLSARILARAPLDAEAMRFRAEMERDPDAAERDMRGAYARSRREAAAAFWLLNQAYVRHDYADVLEKADALLRTVPDLSKYTLSYLYALAADPGGRAALATQLATSPPWRPLFFGTLGDFVSNDDAVALFMAMKDQGAAPTSRELGPYLNARLFKAKDAEGSYNTWLQLLSDAELASLLPVRNLDFANDPSGLPFDWHVSRGRNVTTRFVRLPGQEHERALRIQFGVGRVRFGGVLQVTSLRPGSYVFSGRQSGNMSAKRGMKWQVRCFPSNKQAGESSQLFGSARGWQDFSFEFTLPETPGCASQLVLLSHDARSASEEYASGEISFSGLQVKPAPAPSADDAPPLASGTR